MSSFQVKVLVNQPVHKAFSQFMDKSNMDKWLTNFKKVETVSGKHGEVGSKHKITFLEGGGEVALIEKIIGKKKNKEYTFVVNHDIMDRQTKVEFASQGDNTKITSSVDVQEKGLWKFIMPIITSGMKNRHKQDLEQLKEHLES